jgi:protein-S-isoprenylcysteine O-methyltransferase Ste14
MKNNNKAFNPSIVVKLLFFIVLIPLLPLLISFRWVWWEAWVYAFIYIFGFAISRILAASHHPDLLTERSRMMQHENTKPWDRILAPLVGLGGGLIPLVAGLDARLNWSFSFSLPVKIIALITILAGYTLGAYALIENRFFSGVVRIQTDRGHQVVASGPYSWLRHPGYAGALLMYMVTPLFLDSLWTFLPVFFLAIILIVRTYLEDKTLQDELEGYRNYSDQVRYRLFPGVW